MEVISKVPENKIAIPLPLMTLNKYTSSQRTSYRVGNRAKQECTNKCSIFVKMAMNQGFQLSLPAKLKFVWYCQNKREDPDNIAFQKKFILDGMMKAKLIENDGWGQITGFEDFFYIDKENPRVEVTGCE